MKKAFLPIWIVFIVGIILVAGSTFFIWSLNYKTSKTEEGPVQKPVQKTETIPETTCPTCQKQETLEWKTYLNEKAGFSLKYPGDWNLEVKEEDSLKIVQISKTSGSSAFCSFTVSAFDSQNLSLSEWIEKNAKTSLSLVKEITVDGYQGYKLLKEGPPISLDIWVLKDRIFWLKGTIQSQKASEFLPLIDQIIASFKFLK